MSPKIVSERKRKNGDDFDESEGTKAAGGI
jgi:hypothetical protein